MKRISPGILAAAMLVAHPAQAQTAESSGARAESPNPYRNGITVTREQERAQSKWLRAETQNFLVYGVKEEQVREVATKLERFDRMLRLLTDTPAAEAPNPLSVYLVVGTLQIEQLSRVPHRYGRFSTGNYSAGPTGAFVAADMHWDVSNPDTPKYHEVWLLTEYTRHFLYQNARGAYLPAWYVDGLSLYLSTAQFDKDGFAYGGFHPNMARELSFLRWEPLGDIIAGKLDRDQLYSAESMLLVHYIFASPARVAAFRRYLDAARAGMEPVAAFEAAFGAKMKAIQAKLWQYRYDAKGTRASVGEFVPVDLSLTHLPASADALLLDQGAMRAGIPEPERQQAVLRRAEAALADRGDAFAQRVSAQAQILYGDPAKADATLDALLAQFPVDAELLYFKGMEHLMAGRRNEAVAKAEFAEARKWFARAYRADSDSYPTLYAYAESLSAEPSFLSDTTTDLLLKAALLAPQATQIRVTAALMLMAQGKFDDAQALLEPVTVSPRDPTSVPIPALIEQARAHKRPEMGELLAAFRTTATWRDLNCC